MTAQRWIDWRRAAAGLALGAAVIHVYVAPEHLREWWVYGSFFIGVAVAQLALAGLVLLGPRIEVVLVGIWGTVGLIGIYVVSRTVGLPLTPPGGHHHAAHVAAHLPTLHAIGSGIPELPAAAGAIEPVGPVDLLALALELLLVVLLVSRLSPVMRRLTTTAMLGLGVAAWVFGGVLALG
jgi:hypothetical protein